TLPLKLRTKHTAEIRPIDNPARCKGLGHDRLIADDAKLNIVALGIESPVVEGQHAEHPDAPSDALHADLFALEIRRSLDVGSHHERAVEFVDQPRDENQIEPARHGSDRSAG